MLTATNPLNQATTYAYDTVRQQTSMTDPRNAVTSSLYDGAGRQTRITNALSEVV